MKGAIFPNSNKKRKVIAVYPGSFNPFHKGHYDIYLTAKTIFNDVIIAIGENPDKKIPKMIYEDVINSPNIKKINRIETIKKQIGEDVEVRKFKGFLADFIANLKEKSPYNDYVIVKGVRNGKDFDYEINQMRIMEDQNPSLKFVLIPSKRKYQHISSSAIRAMEAIQEGSAYHYIAKKM